MLEKGATGVAGTWCYLDVDVCPGRHTVGMLEIQLLMPVRYKYT